MEELFEKRRDPARLGKMTQRPIQKSDEIGVVPGFPCQWLFPVNPKRTDRRRGIVPTGNSPLDKPATAAPEEGN